jgi:16S rRNA (uracil1498-N3)-methyltransferase
MHRFFVTDIHNDQVVFSPEQAHQLTAVLRMEPGQQVVALDNNGWEYEVMLVDVNRKRVTAVIQNKRPITAEAVSHVTLYQSLLKRDNFEWVLQKGTELGICKFVPLITQRTVARLPKKTERWQRIIIEAAEQSHRGRIPILAEPMTLSQGAAELNGQEIGLIPWEAADSGSIGELLAGNRETAVALFIGPEGGFSAEEIDLARQQNIIPISLGPRILRAETAAIAATTIVLHELGEMA